MENISLAICDDAEYWCRYLRQVISKSDEVQVIGEAHSAAECINMVQKIKPDILMLDIQMETEQAGIDAVPRLLETCPDMKIIILTSYDEENYIFSAFANGVDDYMMKTHPKDDIINVIRSVYHNTSSLRPEIAKKLTKKPKKLNRSNIPCCIYLIT